MKSANIIKALKADGWEQVAQKGSHIQFKHPTKKGRVSPQAGHPGWNAKEHREASRPEVEMTPHREGHRPTQGGELTCDTLLH